MVFKEFYKELKSVVAQIGGFNATQQKYLWIAPVKCTIVDVRLLSDVATSGSSGSIDYSFQIRNLTASANLLLSAISTNGNEVLADTPYSLTPNQNGAINQGDVLELQITKKSTATDLSSAEIIAVIDYLPTESI